MSVLYYFAPLCVYESSGEAWLYRINKTFQWGKTIDITVARNRMSSHFRIFLRCHDLNDAFYGNWRERSFDDALPIAALA